MTKTDLYIVDTHAHLDMSVFDKDCSDVVARARDAHVNKIINVGTDLESSKKAIGLAEKYPEIFAAVGFHPHDSVKVGKAHILELTEIANHPKVVAIGEIGLDFYRNYSPREKQIKTLRLQLDLATQLGLPVIIHCRQAEREMLNLLHDWISLNDSSQKQCRGVIHCFNSGKATLRQYLDMGFYISLGAYIGYPTSQMHDVILDIPADRLVVETDCPFLPPQRYRGQRNEPAYVLLTVEVLSKITSESYEKIAQKTTNNAHHLFHLGVNSNCDSLLNIQ
ncbi:TatD family hydrolase [Chloroflexota bacterium]